MATDFPNKGDDLKVSLRNSEYAQFDYAFAAGVKENNGEVWRLGGNIRGNEAFNFWTKARDGEETQGTLDWIKEREAWAARHFEDGSQFGSGDLEPTRSNVAGVVAQMKWGVIGTLGEQNMKDVILELIKKMEGKKDEDRAIEDLSDSNRKALENKRDEHNDEVGDTASKRVTLGMLTKVFERGIGAYKTNPSSVRPNVGSPEQWAFARVNSFLFAVKNERFQGGKHDTDVFPDGHPLKSEDERSMEQRHIKLIEETENEIVIHFWKGGMGNEYEGIETLAEDMEESGDDIEKMDGHLEEERLSKTEIIHRAEHMEMEEEDEDDRRVTMAISSEMPVERSFGREVIVHSNETLNLDFLKSGRAPLLLDHDPERQIGVIESVDLDTSARRLRATVRFGRGELASEVYDDVRDGIRSNVSIGYKVRKMERDNDEQDLFRVTDAEILEVSVVSLPADQSVGVGRSSEPSQKSETIPTIEVSTMEKTETQVREEALAAYRKDIAEINALAVRHNQRSFADECITQGMTLAQFRGALLDKIGDKPLDLPEIQMNHKETRQYSLMAALQSAALNGGVVQGFEAEVSQELQRHYDGKSPRGFYVPTSIFKRDIATGSPALGSNLVPEDHLGGEFIDALRANLVISGLGARMMQGLKGDVAIPALNAKTSVGFVAEGSAPGTEGAPTFRQVTMSPKQLVQHVDISRKLMMQSDPSVEQIIRDDLTRQFASKIDEVAIEGGGSNEPTGITQTSGIGSVAMGTNGGAITYAKLVDLEKEVAIDNALAGNLAYLTNPKVVGAMRQTARQASGVEGNFILNDTNTLLGYDVASTTLVPSDLTKGSSSGVCSAVIFGNFNDLMIGMFGGLDILVDPYSLSSSGGTRIAMYQDIDVKVRHAESFAAILDVTT